MATITATSGAGTSLSFLGAKSFHSTRVMMVTTPIKAAQRAWPSSVGTGRPWPPPREWTAGSGSPLPAGLSSTMTWNWLAKISTPMPASMPWMTAGETARNHWPQFNRPARQLEAAGQQHDDAEHFQAEIVVGHDAVYEDKQSGGGPADL